MKGFSTIERRISANADQTKFRVQFKKKGKANAKILSSITEARKVRDQTDLPGARKEALSKAPKKAKRNYTMQSPNKKITLQEIDLSSLNTAVDNKMPTSSKLALKLEVIKDYIETINKILAMN